MKLITQSIREKLLANHKATMKAQGADLGHYPVVKLFNPVGSGTWLLSEMDDQGIAFGLCDLGMGYPELGYVAIQELEQLSLPLGLKIERDLHWTAKKSLSEYADEARCNECIIA